MIHKIISQSAEFKEYPIQAEDSVIDLYRVGDRRSVYPSVLWQNNKTFFGANKINTGFKNQIQVFQYDHIFSNFTYKDVGNGTDSFDEFNHPLTYLWAENDTIYCGQTNVHNAPIDVYKSNLTNDIRSGFTKLDSIAGENAYPQAFRTIGGKTAFCVRQFPEGVGNFNLSVQISDAGIEGTFTQTLITENTVGYRHYNVVPLIYGNPTKHYLISALRNDNAGAVYFAQAVYVTEDFETYSNVDGTFSKNISVDGELTMAEIEANFIVNGSTANDTVNFEVASAIQINNTLYFSTTKAGTTDKHIFKITDDGTVTSEIINIPDLITAGRNPILYYNGVKIVLSVRCSDGSSTKELWACDLNGENYAQQFVYEEGSYQNHILLPDNLNEVNGEYAALLDQDNSEGVVKLLITDNKWIV